MSAPQNRIKINYWDKCKGNGHSAGCNAVAGKVAKTVEILPGLHGPHAGEGVFDLFTSDAFHEVHKHGKTGTKIGWIQEPRELHGQHYDKVANNLSHWFGGDGFKYLYTHDYDLVRTDPTKFKFLLGNGFWIKDPKIYPKTHMCSMIASLKQMTEGQRIRCTWVDKLRKQERDPENVGRFNLFGKDRTRGGAGPEDNLTIETKEEGLCDYMFSVVVENARTDVWITEKVLDCFATGTIPIYWGSKKITHFFNEDGIIFLEPDFNLKQLSKELYLSKMTAVKDNLQRVKKLENPLDYMFDDLYKELGISKPQL